MIKYLIWDFDGVICDSKNIAFEIHNQIAKRQKKLPMIYNEYDYAKIMNEGYDESLGKYLNKDEINQYFFEHREAMYKRRMEFKLHSKVVDFIKNNKIPSIIITATYEKLVLDVLKNNGYDGNMFKNIFGRETEGSKVEKLNNLCQKRKIKKDEIVYIGDTLSDIEFCKKVNIPIISVGYGYCPPELFKKKEILKLCNSEEELVNYISTKIDLCVND